MYAWQKPLVTLSRPWRLVVRSIFTLLLLLVTACTILFLAVLRNIDYSVTTVTDPPVPPFPIGVDPVQQKIYEQPDLETFRTSYVASSPQPPDRRNVIDRLVGIFTQAAWLQNLALSNSRVLVIYAGERQEEIARNFGSILRWDKTEQATFIEQVQAATPTLPEGGFLPGKYVVAKDAGPEPVAKMLTDNFAREVLRRYPADIAAIVPLEEAVTIASLLEREAYDFTDMREISGVIWNRLFTDMPLQIDATLQYVRGSQPVGPWWPVPRAQDKWLDSPFNTYQHKGLPPHPIANPSVEAVLAALNPSDTDCLFYLHAPGGAFYCSATYAEHKANINRHLR